MCCSSWGRKVSDTTEQLNWTESYPALVTLETLGMPNSSPGIHKRLTCLDLPRDLALKKMSCLNLLRDLPIQGSQEVIMPRPAQEPNSQEAVLSRPAWGFNL